MSVKLLTQNGDVHSFDSVEKAQEAQSNYADSFVVQSSEDLEEVPTPVLIAAFNGRNKEKLKLKKFKNRDAAVSKTWEAISGEAPAKEEEEALEAPAPAKVKGTPQGGKKAKAEARAKKEKVNVKEDKSGKPGRDPSYAGMLIMPTALGLNAQRQEGSRRTRSFQVIEANPGLTYEEYLKKGGDPQDLTIIVNRRKHAVVLPADSKLPKAPPEVDDPKGIAARKAERDAAREKKEAEAKAKREAKKEKAPSAEAKKAPAKKAGKAGKVPTKIGGKKK